MPARRSSFTYKAVLTRPDLEKSQFTSGDHRLAPAQRNIDDIISQRYRFRNLQPIRLATKTIIDYLRSRVFRCGEKRNAARPDEHVARPTVRSCVSEEFMPGLATETDED